MVTKSIQKHQNTVQMARKNEKRLQQPKLQYNAFEGTVGTVQQLEYITASTSTCSPVGQSRSGIRVQIITVLYINHQVTEASHLLSTLAHYTSRHWRERSSTGQHESDIYTILVFRESGKHI